MAALPESLGPILDRLVDKAWAGAERAQDGDFTARAADFSPGSTPESLHEALRRLYAHARRWAPGLEVPYFVPPIRLDVVDGAGDFLVDRESYATIGVSAEHIDDPAALLMILSHEACHHILMQSGLKRDDDVPLDEITTDLAMFVCGFGELVLHGHARVRCYGGEGRRVHLGYLTSDEYRQIDDHVRAKRLVAGLPGLAAPAPGDDVKKRRGAAPERPAEEGAIELTCGEAMCKRAFQATLATLRAEGAPWPVRCPACGVFLYPSDILKSASANELEPQRAELRRADGGRLTAVTSADLLRLTRPSGSSAAQARGEAPTATKRAASTLDGASILAEMLASASPIADAPAATQPTRARPSDPSTPARRAGPLARPPARRAQTLAIVSVIAIIIALIAAWLFVSNR